MYPTAVLNLIESFKKLHETIYKGDAEVRKIYKDEENENA